MVVSWLMSKVGKELVSGILFCADAALVWNDMKVHFDKVNTSKMFHLHKAIVTTLKVFPQFQSTIPN